MNKETDRELLELAAKASGVEIAYTPVSTVNRGGSLTKFDVVSWHGPYLKGTEDEWNPLTDDGDALRLAVALEIDLIIGTGSKFVTARNEVTQLNEYEYTQDKAQAVRRAIVRAAAEIGRNLK